MARTPGVARVAEGATRREARRVVGPVLRWLGGLTAALSIACASGGDPEITSQAFDGGAYGESTGTTTGPTTSAGPGPLDDGDEDPGVPTDSGVGPPDLGTCNVDADCVLPAGTCLEPQGTCVGGMCEHPPLGGGTSCEDGDPCTQGDTCDGEGVCIGVPLSCDAPNTEGGMCQDGTCMGMSCATGWDDCNGNLADGCETALGTDSDCGGCGDECAGAAHATGSCSAGSCDYQCTGSWENCDGDWGNGCEIPVGVPHRCDANGINTTNGCWTAYCGNSADPDATNFGTFYCVDCPTCREPSAGQCQWCNHTTGTFYPVDACACGGYLDLAC